MGLRMDGSTPDGRQALPSSIVHVTSRPAVMLWSPGSRNC
jgi:hypothetical protein